MAIYADIPYNKILPRLIYYTMADTVMWLVAVWAAYAYAACLVFSLILCVWGWATLLRDYLCHGNHTKPRHPRHVRFRTEP